MNHFSNFLQRSEYDEVCDKRFLNMAVSIAGGVPATESHHIIIIILIVLQKGVES